MSYILHGMNHRYSSALNQSPLYTHSSLENKRAFGWCAVNRNQVSTLCPWTTCVWLTTDMRGGSSGAESKTSGQCGWGSDDGRKRQETDVRRRLRRYTSKRGGRSKMKALKRAGKKIRGEGQGRRGWRSKRGMLWTPEMPSLSHARTHTHTHTRTRSSWSGRGQRWLRLLWRHPTRTVITINIPSKWPPLSPLPLRLLGNYRLQLSSPKHCGWPLFILQLNNPVWKQ